MFWVENGMLWAEGLTPGSIEDSRDKWEYLFNLCAAGELVHDGGGSTCALCKRWHGNPGCVGCPVRAHTGFFGCQKTPYEDYHSAVERGDLPAATSAAEEMMLFLEKLLKEAV